MNKTIRQFADELGLSVQAVYRYRTKYAEVKTHTHKEGRYLVLDDTAQAFILQRLSPQTQPIGGEVYQELNALRNEKIELLTRIATLERERADALASAKEAGAKFLLASKSQEALTEEISQLRKSLDSFKPSVFGFYRKTR